MYKSKLQEECQRRQWGLPKYSAMKDGPDHNPSFKASVSVNAMSFDSPILCKSSKDAHNEAAKFAFLHLTSPGSSMPSAEPNAGGPMIAETYQGPESDSHALGVKDDLWYQYKNQLQNYSRWKKFDSPLYSSKSEGPPHALRFKATVTVDGSAFESPGFFSTLKEAEHAAAKAALMSLLPDGFQLDHSGCYKNLLQELAQREGFCIPIYKTIKSGAPHEPTFFSTVEIEGEKFYGKAGKSKKLAEIKAASVAYTVLKERALSRTAEFTSLSLMTDETLKSTPGSASTITVDLQQNLEHECQLVSSPATKYEKHAEESKDEVKEVDLAEMFSTNAKVGSEDSILSPLVPCMDKMIGNWESTCSKSAQSLPKDDPSSSKLMPRDLSNWSIAESDMKKTTGTQSYLLCNRVRVYTCFPNIEFPKGITVLPISDNKWVAVSLEFPNEKGN